MIRRIALLVLAVAGAAAPVQAARLLTIGGDVTEIVFALGAGAEVVGVDRNSRYPAAVAGLPDVGQRQRLSPEGVLAVQPDLILMAERSGPAAAIEVLTQAGVRLVTVPERYSAAGVAEKIGVIAAAIGREAEGRVLAAIVAARYAAIERIAAAVPPERRRRVLFTHSIAGGRLAAVAGRDTPADEIIALAGGVNAMAALQGVKPVSAEAMLGAAPEVILMARGSDGRAPDADEVFAVPALQGTPAARTRAYVLMEGPFMLGFGPRTADAVRDLARALYPDLTFPDGTP